MNETAYAKVHEILDARISAWDTAAQLENKYKQAMHRAYKLYTDTEPELEKYIKQLDDTEQKTM